MMKKLLFLSLLLLTHFSVFTQQRTHLPYSIFGIGEIQPKGFSRNMGMGRTGIGLSSDLYLNNANPASYHSLDSISFFFDFGISSDFVKYRTTSVTQHGNDINIMNIAMGFRIAKNWTSSIGIAPYSEVGYKIVTEQNVEGTVDEFQAELTGNGGLTQFYWDNSYVLFKHLSLGVNVTYLFGNIEYTEKLTYDQFDKEIYSKQTSYLNKVYADFGVQYFFRVKEKTRVTLGGVFGNNHELNYKQRINIYDSDGAVLEDEITENATFDFPYYYGGGIAVDYDRKLTISADYYYHDWSGTSSGSSDFSYVNTNTFRIGAEYIPGRLNEHGYLGRWAYRIGYYHEGSNLEIYNTAIPDNGFSVGLGIPFLQNRTSINLAYNTGVRGTLENGFVKENYHTLMLSLTLHDWWFIKRKYD